MFLFQYIQLYLIKKKKNQNALFWIFIISLQISWKILRWFKKFFKTHANRVFFFFRCTKAVEPIWQWDSIYFSLVTLEPTNTVDTIFLKRPSKSVCFDQLRRSATPINFDWNYPIDVKLNQISDVIPFQGIWINLSLIIVYLTSLFF